MEHDAELSLQDLAYLMMAVSDNAATDVIIARVGLPRINATLRSLGLERTVVAGDCANIVQAITGGRGQQPGGAAVAEEPRGARAAAGLLDPRRPGGRADHPARADGAAGHDLARGPGYPPPTTGCAGGMAQQLCHARIAGAFPYPPWLGAKSGPAP